MLEQQTIERAHEEKCEGKPPSTQAGDFVREEFHHIRQGKHGARSVRQAIAIGLSKARRAGIKLPLPPARRFSGIVRRQGPRDLAPGPRGGIMRVSPMRSPITQAVLRRESHALGSSRAISLQAHRAALRRGHAQGSAATRRAARTRIRAGLASAAPIGDRFRWWL